MADRTPAQAFPPGDFIREELEARGWTQADLAEILGRPTQFVNELLSGRKNLTPETASGLAEALGTSADFWLNLESAYRLWLLRQKEAQSGKQPGEVAKRSKLYELAPVKDMVKRGWIPSTSDTAELEASLNSFYERRVLEEPITLPMAAKKSTGYGATTPVQFAWAFRARHLAARMRVARFSRDIFARGLADLHKFVTHEADARRVPRLLAELGVRFVVVEHLPRSKMDGAAFWLSENEPVIAVSVRYDRIDHFWFTLAHECAHVLHGDGESIDDNLVGEGATKTDAKPDIEKRADLWAADYLLKTDEIERFILRVKPFYSKTRIIQFANRVRVHPGVIVGQLQRRDEITYAHSREMLVKVRSQLIESALTDGWGHIPPRVHRT